MPVAALLPSKRDLLIQAVLDPKNRGKTVAELGRSVGYAHRQGAHAALTTRDGLAALRNGRKRQTDKTTALLAKAGRKIDNLDLDGITNPIEQLQAIGMAVKIAAEIHAAIPEWQLNQDSMAADGGRHLVQRTRRAIRFDLRTPRAALRWLERLEGKPTGWTVDAGKGASR